jgi:hypothetical protein
MFKCLTKVTRVTAPVEGVPVALDLITPAVSQIGFGEIHGNNLGEHVDNYAQAVGMRAPILWCAAFVYWCYLDACERSDVVPLVKGSAGARRLCKNVLTAGGTKHEIPYTGDIALWSRGVGNTWKGHVGIVIGGNGGTFSTIEGNRGTFPSKVRVYNHAIGEAGLLGFYRLPPHLGQLK